MLPRFKHYFFKPKSLSLLPHPILHHLPILLSPIHISIHHTKHCLVVSLELSVLSNSFLSQIPKFNKSWNYADSLTKMSWVFQSLHFYLPLQLLSFLLPFISLSFSIYPSCLQNYLLKWNMALACSKHFFFFPIEWSPTILSMISVTLLPCPTPTW